MRRVEFSRVNENALRYIMYEGNGSLNVDLNFPNTFEAGVYRTQPTRHEEADGRM